jgi:sulfur carrier protein
MDSIYYLNNRIEEWKPDLTIADVILQKNYKFPMLVVKINGELIKRAQYEEALIPANAQVQILHLMSGG